MWRAAGQTGWKIERLSSWRITPDLQTVPEPVVYVEALMAPTLAAEFGITLIEPPEDWLIRLPDEYRQRAIQLTTLGAARANPNPRFVKPPNDKSFAAGVYRGTDLPKEFSDDMPVLVAEVVQWQKEFRCFILDRQIQTFSIYLRDGELQKEQGYESTTEEDAEMIAFVSRVLGDTRVDIPRAVVLDAGVIWDRGWAVVELNSAWGSGLYGCEETKVLEVLRHAKA